MPIQDQEIMSLFLKKTSQLSEHPNDHETVE